MCYLGGNSRNWNVVPLSLSADSPKLPFRASLYHSQSGIRKKSRHNNWNTIIEFITRWIAIIISCKQIAVRSRYIPSGSDNQHGKFMKSQYKYKRKKSFNWMKWKKSIRVNQLITSKWPFESIQWKTTIYSFEPNEAIQCTKFPNGITIRNSKLN